MQKVKQYSDLITIDDVRQLVKHEGGPAVSLLMPTFKTAPESKQNPIRFKNMVTAARHAMRERKLDDGTIDAVLAPVLSMVNSDAEEWQHVSEGLAIFLAPDAYYSFQTRKPLEEFVYVNEEFHVRQLLPVVTRGDDFFILTLNLDDVRLLRANRSQIGEVPLEDMPNSLAEALRFDEFERQLQVHSSGRGAADGSDAVYHGQGAAGDESKRNENILQFFKALDNEVCDYLNGSGSPLILAGVDHLRGSYRKANHYAQLLDDDVTVDPSSLNKTELHQQAWTVVSPYFEETAQAAISRYEDLASPSVNLGTDSLEKIVPAAYYSRIDTLFLPDNGYRWGHFITETGETHLYESYEVGAVDLLNIAARHTTLNGGVIYTLPEEDVPGIEGVAAILRY